MQTILTAVAGFRRLDRGTKAGCYATAVLAVAVWVLLVLQMTGTIR